MRAARATRACRSAAAAALGALALAAPLAHARTGASPSLVVTFTATGLVTVTLPDGTPVGTTSGAPTVIPAGFYTITLNGPGDCINLPLWELRGPGVDLNDDMLGGEVDTHALYATFLPSTTYTWHIDRAASTVYTFRTSADVAGTAPAQSGVSPRSGAGGAPVPTSEDIVGSAILPARGTIAGGVSARGVLTFTYRGRSVTKLRAGRYTFAVTDRSSTLGFLLEQGSRSPRVVTGAAFVGRRSASVALTKGRWLVLPAAGKPAYAVVVS